MDEGGWGALVMAPFGFAHEDVGAEDAIGQALAVAGGVARPGAANVLHGLDVGIDIRRIRGWVERAGYSGLHEVEIFSELDWWQRDPDEVLSVCKERHARCC